MSDQPTNNGNYQRAVKTCPTCVGANLPTTVMIGDETYSCPSCTDGWIDVPVTEDPGTLEDVFHGRASFIGGEPRPVSWAKILPGDRVLIDGDEATLLALVADYYGGPEMTPCPFVVLFDDFVGDETSWRYLHEHDLALIVDGDPPPHRAGHPSWWPT